MVIGEPLRSILEFTFGGGGLLTAGAALLKAARDKGAMDEWRKQVEEKMEHLPCALHEGELKVGTASLSSINTSIEGLKDGQDRHDKAITELTKVVYKIAGKIGVNGFGGQ